MSGPSGSYNQSDKVYSMNTCGEKLLVATAGRKVCKLACKTDCLGCTSLFSGGCSFS